MELVETKIEETVQDTSAQQGAAQNSEKQPEQPGSGVQDVDFDKALQDSDYLDSVNAKLRGEVKEPETPKEKPAEKQEAAVTPQPDDDPVVETIIYRGQPVEVRKSQMKALLQKGRHLEIEMQKYAPYRRALEQNPDLAEALRSGNVNDWIAARAKTTKPTAEPDDDLPQVEGYDKNDLRAVASIVDARLAKKIPVQSPAQANESQRIHDTLRIIDPHYGENKKMLEDVVQELERTLPADKFQDFFSRHNDPTRVDPKTGQPYFLKLYREADAERRRRVEAQSRPKVAPAPVPVAQVAAAPRPAQSARIVPGAASQTNTARATHGADPWSMPQSDFDKAINDVLMR